MGASPDRLHGASRNGTYVPQPVFQHLIPEAGQPRKFRRLGIPIVDDRMWQQALLDWPEPIVEPVFDAASSGYRQGQSTYDALPKVWGELQEEREWVVKAWIETTYRTFRVTTGRSSLKRLRSVGIGLGSPSRKCRLPSASRLTGSNTSSWTPRVADSHRPSLSRVDQTARSGLSGPAYLM